MLDDVENFLLPRASKAQPVYSAMWIDSAQFNLTWAAQIRQQVQKVFDKYGPSIVEIGGD